MLKARMRRLSPAIAALLAVLLGLACEGGDEAASPSPPLTPPASSPTPLPSPSPGSAAKIAYVDPDGNLALINADGSGKEVLTAGGGVEGLRWSPDGSLIALEGGDGAGFGVRVVRPDGEVIFELKDASTPLWSPQGDRLAVSQGSGIAVYDAGGGDVLEVADATGAAWSPDGETLAFLRIEADNEGVPRLVTLATGAESPLSDDIEADDAVYPIAWHHEGQLIAYRDGIYSLTGGAKVDLPGVPVFWSPDGRLLLVTLEFNAAANATPAQVLDMTQEGKAIIGLDIRPADDGTPPWLHIQRWTVWSPNGRFLVYLDPQPFRVRVRVYDTVAIRQSIYPNVRGERPSASPDTGHIVFMDEGAIWVLAVDGSSLRNLAEGSYPVWQPAAP